MYAMLDCFFRIHSAKGMGKPEYVRDHRFGTVDHSFFQTTRKTDLACITLLSRIVNHSFSRLRKAPLKSKP